MSARRGPGSPRWRRPCGRRPAGTAWLRSRRGQKGATAGAGVRLSPRRPRSPALFLIYRCCAACATGYNLQHHAVKGAPVTVTVRVCRASRQTRCYPGGRGSRRPGIGNHDGGTEGDAPSASGSRALTESDREHPGRAGCWRACGRGQASLEVRGPSVDAVPAIADLGPAVSALLRSLRRCKDVVAHLQVNLPGNPHSIDRCRTGSGRVGP